MHVSSRPPIRPRDVQRAAQLRELLVQFEATSGPAPGVTNDVVRETFLAQLIDSERRVEYVRRLIGRDISDSVLRSGGRIFDPLRGAVLMARRGNHDEACWLVFLSAHFARNRRTEWQLAGDFYNQLGSGTQWTWLEVSTHPYDVLPWLDAHREDLRAAGGRFGNHRKYESLAATGTGLAIVTYVDWVGPSHETLFAHSAPAVATPRERFGQLYKSMAQVARFGRVGRFDYLTMLYKLGLADIEPDACHIDGSATGPRTGAKLLLWGDARAVVGTKILEARLRALADSLGVSADVLEDALCNWQKSPAAYVFFGG